jgi:hypothetical protein
MMSLDTVAHAFTACNKQNSLKKNFGFAKLFFKLLAPGACDTILVAREQHDSQQNRRALARTRLQRG